MNKLKELSSRFSLYVGGLSDVRAAIVNTLITVGVILVTVVVTEALYWMGAASHSTVLIYLLAVIIISRMTPRYIYGVIGATLSTLAWDFFSVEPRFRLTLTLTAPVTLIIMLGVTVFISALTIRMKYQTQLANERGQRWQIMYELNQKLLADKSHDEVINLSFDYMVSRFARPVAYFSGEDAGQSVGRFTGDNADVFMRPGEIKRVKRMFRAGDSAVSELVEESDGAIYYIPVTSWSEKRGAGRVLCVFCLDCREKPLTPGEIMLAQLMARQISLAVELAMLSETRSRVMVESEKEKMRGTLLRSISHDLRTPLTSIKNAGSLVLEQKDMDEQSRDELVTDIVKNADWLTRMVENILTITKISEEAMKVQKSPESAEEVISQAVSIVRKSYPYSVIHVRVPDAALIVPMDATLICQVLINMLQNAVSNSREDGLILMDLKRQGDFARFEVSDNGTGIPAHLMDKLFDSYTPPAVTEPSAPGANRRMGIGLSICKTIVHAHGGTISGFNRPEGGAKFTFTLPITEEDDNAGGN